MLLRYASLKPLCSHDCEENRCNCHAGPVVPTWIPDGYVLKVKTLAGKSEPPRSQWRFYATRIIDRYRPSGNLLQSY